jgi:AcrR family transcriptional regulator
MGINQNDLRVIKTKRGLREAFIRLLLEKGYEAISIQDLATEAETVRVTSYR